MTVFAAILLTVLLSALDQTVVGTALPRIVTDPQGYRSLRLGERHCTLILAAAHRSAVGRLVKTSSVSLDKATAAREHYAPG